MSSQRKYTREQLWIARLFDCSSKDGYLPIHKARMVCKGDCGDLAKKKMEDLVPVKKVDHWTISHEAAIDISKLCVCSLTGLLEEGYDFVAFMESVTGKKIEFKGPNGDMYCAHVIAVTKCSSIKNGVELHLQSLEKAKNGCEDNASTTLGDNSERRKNE